ncbi:hypothetical protein MTYP_01839 [Methylophilaceae bacterium]|nr:hypothetical protein MTYP_01839 [Methylophilaceae bacterium]
MKKILFGFMLCAGAGLPLSAIADVYKIIDADGRVTYTNVPTKGAKKIEIDPPPTNGAGASSGNEKAKTPASFPRVDKQTQNTRDDKRKEILRAELEAEKKALDDARKAYVEGESMPEVYKGANGKTYRNVPKFEEKMRRLQADVDMHQKNVELLQKELEALN